MDSTAGDGPERERERERLSHKGRAQRSGAVRCGVVAETSPDASNGLSRTCFTSIFGKVAKCPLGK